MSFSEASIDRLVFALDVPDRREAERFVKKLNGSIGCFKVGLELFVREGPDVLKAISENSSADIFLDLKLHDIPNTVTSALKSAAGFGVRFITVHSCEGGEMLEAAAEVRSEGLEVLAVTVLTSMAEENLSSLGYRKDLTLMQLALERAALAKKAGCSGIVCSGKEAAGVKEICGPEFKIVVPGIRPHWTIVEGDDQSRISTPRDAIINGADLLVVGRPIRTAADPKKAAQKILEEIDSACHS